MKTVIIVTPDYATAAEYAAKLDRDWLWIPDRFEAVNYIERLEREHNVVIDPFWVVPT